MPTHTHTCPPTHIITYIHHVPVNSSTPDPQGIAHTRALALPVDPPRLPWPRPPPNISGAAILCLIPLSYGEAHRGPLRAPSREREREEVCVRPGIDNWAEDEAIDTRSPIRKESERVKILTYGCVYLPESSSLALRWVISGGFIYIYVCNETSVAT